MEPIDKDLQEIIDVIAEGVKTGIDNLKDGFQYTDIFAFIPVLSKIPVAINDAANALHYLRDMNEQKESDIIDAVVAKLGDEPGIREGARRLLRALSSNYMLFMFFKERAAAKAADGTTPS